MNDETKAGPVRIRLELDPPDNQDLHESAARKGRSKAAHAKRIILDHLAREKAEAKDAKP